MELPKPNIYKLFKLFFKAIPYIVIIILILFLNRQCEETERVTDFYNNEKQIVQVYKNKIGTLTATVTATELTNKQLKDLLLKKNDTLKKLASEFNRIRHVTKIKEVIRIDSVKVPFEVEIPCVFERKGFYDTDSHFKFNYALNQTGFSLSDISIPNEQTIITGTKRKWIFGKQTLHTDITNSNPYLQTKEVQTIVVPIEKKWYENQFLWLGVGAVGGVLLTK